MFALLSKTFPRLQKRGPIEARRVNADAADQFTEFPRLQKRGPIEAMAQDAASRHMHVFPRLQKRGPIEAQAHDCVV